MSLATKSRWLFGIAAAAIIVAALLVAFGRTEQLTDQLNIASGRGVTQIELARHVRTGELHPTTRPGLALGEAMLVEPTIVGIDSIRRSEPGSFENTAVRRFDARREVDAYYETVSRQGQTILRYAQPLRNGTSCIACHTPAPRVEPIAPATIPAGPFSAAVAARIEQPDVPATQPTALQLAEGELLGVMLVEVQSPVSWVQVLLNRLFLLGAGLVAGLLAVIILSTIISRLILRPMRVLQETAEKVSAGDLKVRADISSGDEFQKLGETLNRMLRNLRTSQESLRSANKTLDLQIVRLSEVNVGLNEANKLKNEFLANVSHELRTPLNSIIGFADLLRESIPKTETRTQRYVANIHGSGTNLLELINDLLDLAKIEAGRVELRVGELSLGDLFEALANLLKPLCEKRALTIQVGVSPDVPILRSDAGRLQQVLYNLLSNAIKFSPDRERIDLIAARQDEQHIRIVVVDRGPGIAPEHHQLIFEKFRQLDQSVTRKFGGTGLGLSISRELVHLLGGHIGVLSEPGKGATFWIELPIQPPADPAESIG